MNDSFMTIIVAAPVVEQMRRLAASWSGGEGMWVMALADGSAEPTHYISSGYISGIIAGYFPYSEFTQSVDADGNPEMVELNHPGDIDGLIVLLNQDNPDAGLTRELVDQLLPHLDISTQPPHDAMARLGLELWSDLSVPL